MTFPQSIAIYTCVTNGYDRVLPPVDPVPGVDHILFTDRPDVQVSGWQMRPLAMAEGLSPALANRYHKLLPHKALPEHDASIYLDANIQIISSLAPLIEDVFASPVDLAVYAHPSRRTIAEEARACLTASRVKAPEALSAEVADYQAEGFPDEGTLTGNSILFRPHLRPAVIEAMEMWWDLVASKSGRDQISLPYLRWKLGLDVRVLTPHFAITSPYFKRYPHWSKAGRRARLHMRLAENLGVGGMRGQMARRLHAALDRSYNG